MGKEALISEIKKLKEEKDSLILAHYYVDGELQELADYVGDSYGLSLKAVESTKERIIFCGVRFMGESAKILNPEKRVYLVNEDALCPMAEMVDQADIELARDEYENLVVVTYINSSAETKRYSDLCITSSNAVRVMEKIKSENILVIPDKNLGTYIQRQFEGKNIILHSGYCYVHNNISYEEVLSMKKKYPNAKVLVHPETNTQVFKLADYIGSTSGILKYARESSSKEFIIATERGILHRLKKDSPNKDFYFPSLDQTCLDMKKMRLEDLRDVLKYDLNEVILDHETMEEARLPLMKMMEYAKK